MKKEPESKSFCRFLINDRIYSGTLRGQMVDLVKGEPWGELKYLQMSYPLSKVKLLLPLLPGKIFCIGRNYRNHVLELGHELPTEPVVFMKPPSALIGPGESIVLPDWAGRIDYEGELAVVIGKACRNIAPEEACDYILGFTCANDVTARDLQRKDGQWTRSKGFDTFAPLGPFILLQSFIPDSARITTRLNGETVQSDYVGNTIFHIEFLISYISRFATLFPGDVILTGTPEGVGALHPGDIIEVEISGIGVLRNFCLPASTSGPNPPPGIVW